MKGWTQAMTCGAQPNQRLKLPAPVPNGPENVLHAVLYNCICEYSSLAPQLKRDSLGGA